MNTEKETTTLANKLKQFIPYFISIVAFITCKLLYPLPDLSLDSKNYIDWGFRKFPVSYRPVGYSKFLMWFDGMPNNHLNIVIVQYIIFLAACFFFNHTVFSLFKFNRKYKIITYWFTIYNPIAFFLANLLLADSLFLSMSMIWLASFILILSHRYNFYLMLGINLLSFYIMFGLRGNALYYPVIMLLAAIFSKKTVKLGVLIVSSIIVGAYFYNTTMEKTEAFTGTATISGFGKWALANNALHIYHFADVDEDIFENAEELKIHRLAIALKDSIRYEYGMKVTTDYMWNKYSPLRIYLRKNLNQKAYQNYFVGWYAVSDLYSQYGKKLIASYPLAFLQGFLLPNLLNYFVQDLDVFQKYNWGNETLDDKIRGYLDIKGEHLPEDKHGIEEKLMNIVRWIYLPVNILVVCSLIWFIITWIKRKNLNDALKLVAIFYIITLFLSVLAHPLNARYLAVLLLPGSVFPLMFMAWRNKPAEDNKAIKKKRINA